MTPHPRWRWCLWLACNEALLHVSWEWLWDLWAWCILPEWHGWDRQPLAKDEGLPW
jgi:hypothetical protein